MDVSDDVDADVSTVMEEIRKEGDRTDEVLQALYLEEDEGWEDLEPDIEAITVQSLFDETVFQDVRSMLKYCLDKYAFDFLKVRNEFDLDFLGTVKLVNYIRSEVKRGHPSLEITSLQEFNSDQYLQPVLADDALLFSIGDLDDESDSECHSGNTVAAASQQNVDSPSIAATARMTRAMNELKSDRHSQSSRLTGQKVAKTAASDRSKDDHYWESYDQLEIHETMIKDQIRTEAYRDFIMTNSELFRDKVVLDVGCGSGILSLFCAKAGAKAVYAVDRSDIINQARAVAFDNKLNHIVKFYHGRIEDMTTADIPEVDIIVSEWMGYALLYEAMLDSVLHARDKFLRPGGILLPCEAHISIAPVYDPMYTAEKVSFWKNVYGFDMSALPGNRIYEEARVRTMPPDTIVGISHVFATFDLYTCKKSDLSFKKPFLVVLDKDILCLDGFAIWFDVCFGTERNKLSDNSTRNFSKDSASRSFCSYGARGLSVLSTSPHSGVTHWEQTYLLIDPAVKVKVQNRGLLKHEKIEGEVTFAPRSDNDRAIDIGIKWSISEVEGSDQTWAMM